MSEHQHEAEDIRELFWHAQELEEYADSMGANPDLYAVADEAWSKAFDAAERAGGAKAMEQLAAAYGWSTPAQREADQADKPDNEEDEDGQPGRYLPVWKPVYVCTDPEANGHQCPLGASRSASTERPVKDSQAAKAERREVITNNKAWLSAEAVRREWLTTFLARKTPPKGALR